MNNQLNIVPQSIKKTGWVLAYGNAVWGEIYPADGQSGAIYGWTGDLRFAKIAERDTMPPKKQWFSCAASRSDILKMESAEWVRVEIDVTYTLNLL